MKIKPSPAAIVEKKLAKNRPINQDEATTVLAHRDEKIAASVRNKRAKKPKSAHAAFRNSAEKIERKEGLKPNVKSE